MKKKRYTEEQIIGVLKEHEAGVPAQDLLRRYGISNGTFYRWKSKYGGMEVAEATQRAGVRERQAEAIAGGCGAGQGDAQGRSGKKVVKPAGRCEVVVYPQARYTISQRRACGLASISRKAMRYRSVRAELDQPLVQRLKELAETYPCYGYLMLHALLKAESLVVNRKRTYRLYCQQGLQVRTKRRKKLVRPRVTMPAPTQPNESWSADFVHDQLADGRRIRVLNIVDDYSRVCVAQLLDTSISGLRVARLLEELATSRGLPERLTLDNGTEFTSKAMFLWSQASGVKLNFIQPGKPTQNAFVESFNGKFRDGCLNQHWFLSLDEARRTIDQWRNHYNHERAHSSLNYTPPACFEAQAA